MNDTEIVHYGQIVPAYVCNRGGIAMADQLPDVLPRINVLTEEQIERIHAYALQVLSSVGIRVDSAQARKIFAQAGGKVKSDNIVLIPSDLVSWALEAAPSFVDVYNRRGQHLFRLGGPQKSQTRFGVGVTNLHYQDPATDRIEPFTRKHMAISTRLSESLSSFDVVSTIGILRDISPEDADLFGTLEMIANTVKPLVVLVSEERCFGDVLDLLEHLTGDLSTRPFVMPYVNPISPLVLNGGTTDKMMTAIKRGLPFIFSNYGMSGASTPISPAGTMAVQTAELLAGLVFSQLVKKETPIILGSLPVSFDMKTMVNRYTPQGLLLNLACAELMAFYQLPHCGTSGNGSGWGADMYASDLLCMNHLTGCLGKVGLAPFVGGSFYSVVFSPAIVVYSDEIIRKARLLERGFALSDDLVSLNEIETVGPGGNFLMAESTLKQWKQMQQDSVIWPHIGLEKWQARGCPKADEYLRKYTVELLKNVGKPEDHDELIEKGEIFIHKIKEEK